MPTPTHSSAYPPAMLAAVRRALAEGKFFIPSNIPKGPSQLRLQFYGLLAALRKENAAEEIERVSFHVLENGLEIRLKESEGVMADLEKALGGGTSPIDQAADSIFQNLTRGQK